MAATLLYNALNADVTHPILLSFILPVINRKILLIVTVALLHAALIFAVHRSQLPRTAVQVVQPILMSRVIERPAPITPLAAPAPPARPPLRPLPPQKNSKPDTKTLGAPAPAPMATVEPAAPSNAPTVSTSPQAAPAPFAATGAPGLGAGTAGQSTQLPSSNADYLQNLRPAYPPISRRLNEQGKTTVRVLIDNNGEPLRADIATSSGFNRLDEAAVATVMRWRYVPGKRNGVAETMWFNVPINWVLE